jgi:DNA (cytosine-5)-methyltransferase 1
MRAPRHYYNEMHPPAAEWLRNLMRAGLIEDGYVDERSIVEVAPVDLAGFDQCHFFAGIGGWPLALRLAGISPYSHLWTGSCPCQPFSQAGKGDGFDDERHLWPSWYWLASQCKPPIILGEQVASPDVDPWVDLVQADMEGMDYAFGCVAFPAASIGAPHIRDRLYWLGYRDNARLERLGGGHRTAQGHRQEPVRPASSASSPVWLANEHGDRHPQTREGLAKAERHGVAGNSGDVSGLWVRDPLEGFWRGADWLLGRDAKWRPVEPGTFPLVDGLPDRVEPLRAYGNAIVPQQGAAFVEAVAEILA